MSDQCNCRQCLRDRNEENPHGSGWPTELTMMIVCKTCGDKRCPAAINHRNECTGSNEPNEVVAQSERAAREPQSKSQYKRFVAQGWKPAQEPSKEQLTQLLNGLDCCHVEKSKDEFLRTWIRDYIAAQIAERDARIAKLEAAARALIERWDTPLWKDVPATGNYITALRKVLGDGNDAQVP